MKTVQENGTPDLVPFVKTSAPAPVPPPTVAPTEPVPSALPTEPAPPKPVASDLKTYSGDFSERIKETHAATATVLAAEQDAAPRAPEPNSARSSRGFEKLTTGGNLIYIIAGVALLVIGAVGTYFVYARYLNANAPVVIISPLSAPIFVDERVEVSGTDGALIQEIKQSVAQPLSRGAVRLLYASSTADQSVFSMLTVAAPDILLRNIQSNGSMAGVVNSNGVQSPFFILSVTEYGVTFSGMLSWETDMPRALAGLFPAYPVPTPIVATSTMATTTATTTMGSATVPPAPSVVAGF